MKQATRQLKQLHSPGCDDMYMRTRMHNIHTYTDVGGQKAQDSLYIQGY